MVTNVLDAAEITRIFEEEQKAGIPKVYRRDQVPAGYEAITMEWLTDVVCADVPGAQVAGFSFDERDDGLSNRRRIFLDYNAAGEAACLPSTVFCKATETLGSRIMLGVHMAAEGEVNFYGKVRGRLSIEAPRARYAGFNARNLAYLVMLDDIAGQVEFCHEDTDIDRAAALQQVLLLADLHGTFYKSPELGTEALPFATWPFWWENMKKRVPDYEKFCMSGFRAAESVISPRLFARADEIMPAIAESVRRHNDLPQTLVHNDPHLRNWYRTLDGRMGLGDWQTMTVGNWARDVGYCMSTSLRIEDRRAWETDLVAAYLDRLVHHGVPEMRIEDAMREIGVQLMTAMSFWLTTLAPDTGQPDAHPNKSILALIERVAWAIDDHQVLDTI